MRLGEDDPGLGVAGAARPLERTGLLRAAARGGSWATRPVGLGLYRVSVPPHPVLGRPPRTVRGICAGLPNARYAVTTAFTQQ